MEPAPQPPSPLLKTGRVPWPARTERLSRVAARFAQLRLDGFPALHGALHRASGWAHVAAAVPPLVSDFVKPAAQNCTAWVLVVALAAVAVFVIAIKMRRVAKETGEAIGVFCGLVALYATAVLGLQYLTGDPHGAAAHMVPGIEELQQSLG